MTSPVIITFKKYPDLGKLKVVADDDDGICTDCALNSKPTCNEVQANNHCGMKGAKYHFERVNDAD